MEPDETKDLTPREVRLCREAWLDGVSARDLDSRPMSHGDEMRLACRRWPDGYTQSHLADSQRRFVDAAVLRFPSPLVEVPRVESAGGFDYRVMDGALQVRDTHVGTWIPATDVLARTHAVNKVLASPTVTVPADQVPQ